jgi:hypothetical protein
MISQEIAYIILTFILVSAFISIFFFTYVADMEEAIIKKELEGIVSDILKEMKLYLTPEQKLYVKEAILKNMKTPDMTEANTKVDENNKALLMKTVIVFSSLMGAGLLIVGLLWAKYKFNMLSVVGNSIFIVLVVALTEIIFVNIIAANYILIDSNYVKYIVLDTLERYSNFYQD